MMMMSKYASKLNRHGKQASKRQKGIKLIMTMRVGGDDDEKDVVLILKFITHTCPSHEPFIIKFGRLHADCLASLTACFWLIISSKEIPFSFNEHL